MLRLTAVFVLQVVVVAGGRGHPWEPFGKLVRHIRGGTLSAHGKDQCSAWHLTLTDIGQLCPQPTKQG